MTLAAHTFTIAQISSAYGVTHRSLRFYEQRGLLKPGRDGGERRYGRADEIRLQLILKGKRLGFSLEEVRQLILPREPSRDTRLDATAALSLEQIEQQLVYLEARRAEIDAALDELRRHLPRQDHERMPALAG